MRPVPTRTFSRPRKPPESAPGEPPERHPRSVPRCSDPCRGQQPDHSRSMAAIGFEQLEHASVRAAWLTGQRPTHDVRQVVITGGYGVAVTQGNGRHLGRGPRPDAGNAQQVAPGFLHSNPSQLVEPVGDGGRVADDVGFSLFDSKAVERPVRRRKQSLWGWRQDEARVARGRFAELANHEGVGRSCLDARHFLFKHGRDERFEYSLSTAEAQSGVPSVNFEEQRVPRTE